MGSKHESMVDDFGKIECEILDCRWDRSWSTLKVSFNSCFVIVSFNLDVLVMV